jgi:hypothetical protein
MNHEMRPDIVWGHLLVVPLGDISLGVWISTTIRDWRLGSHKGQLRFTTGASNAAAL